MRAFESKGLGEDVALKNARLAKILTADDYDNGPILFTPTNASYRSNSGAGVQTEENAGPIGESSEGGDHSSVPTDSANMLHPYQ